jgi:hypothetical protein
MAAAVKMGLRGSDPGCLLVDQVIMIKPNR